MIERRGPNPLRWILISIHLIYYTEYITFLTILETATMITVHKCTQCMREPDTVGAHQTNHANRKANAVKQKHGLFY